MRFTTAMGISVAFHAVLAAGVCVYRAWLMPDVVLAELDLSSVELSFAEEEDAVAPEVLAPPPAPEPPPMLPKRNPPPPEPPVIEDPLPPSPELTTIGIPEPPPEPPPPLDVPDPVQTEKTPQQTEAGEIVEDPPPEQPASPAPSVPSAAPRQAHVEAMPALKKTIRPDYPRGARLRGEEGDVQLEIAVDAQGGVTSVALADACPFAELNEAALKAARKARFRPARQGRKTVPCTVRITLTFRLRD
ncbi:MAG: energy transducer TonB [Kiritimatiellia bacterium]